VGLLQECEKGKENLIAEIINLKSEIKYLNSNEEATLSLEIEESLNQKPKKIETKIIKQHQNGFAKVVRGERSYSTIEGKPNIIKDNLRELLWQREDNGKKMSYSEADKYCKNLTLDGIKDWRLPTMEELYYLADRSKRVPSIDTEYFKKTKTNWYWTSTEKLGERVSFWITNFDDGYDGWGDGRYLVRCVR
jgi:hypothetical protein